MREIKFRVWDKDTNEMYIPNDKTDFSDGIPYFADCDFQIPMQYTGLKDKNGVEVYEFDIVEVGINKLGYNGPKDYRNKPIRWSDWRGCWTFDPEERDHNKQVVWEAAIYSDIEVIGNIYENPELLERKADE